MDSNPCFVLLALLFPKLAHVPEYGLLAELQFFGLIDWHVGQVADETDDITRVDLHVGVFVVRDRVVAAFRVRAWDVAEPIGVEGVGEDVVVVDTAESIMFALFRCEHEFGKVFHADALHADSFLAHDLLSEPELSVFVL